MSHALLLVVSLTKAKPVSSSLPHYTGIACEHNCVLCTTVRTITIILGKLSYLLVWQNGHLWTANPSANSRRHLLRRWYVKELINVVESFFLFLKVRMQEKEKEVPGDLFSRGGLLADLNHLEIYSSDHRSQQFLPVHVIAPRLYFQRYLQKFHHTSFCHVFRWTYFYVVHSKFNSLMLIICDINKK